MSSATTRRCAVLLALLGVVLGVLAVAVPTAPASASPAQLTDAINRERAARGLPALAVAGDLQTVAQRWSEHMASTGQLAHNPRVADQVTGWRAIAENVGRGGGVTAVHTALMGSTGHRTNILGSYHHVGVGVASDGSQVWVTQVFRRTANAVPAVEPNPCPQPTAAGAMAVDSPAIVRSGHFFLRGSYTTGGADVCFPFGLSTDEPVMGDWDGNGTRTPGVFRAGTWYLRNRNAGGAADITLSFGSPGDRPVVGDWNNDGVDTVGVFRSGRWYLRNANSSGPADGSVTYGQAGDVPVVGDWNRDGTDTLGIFRSGLWALTNRLDQGTADGTFSFGQAGDQPVVGDWNRDATDTLGVVRSGQWYLTNRFDSGVAEGTFRFGTTGDRARVFR